MLVNDLESNVFVGSALIDMYAKCRYTDSARQVFDKMSKEKKSGYMECNGCRLFAKWAWRRSPETFPPNGIIGFDTQYDLVEFNDVWVCTERT